MTQTHRSTFTTSGWQESDLETTPGGLRQTAVHYGVTYIGDVAGTSALSLVMVYKPDQTVDYVGYEAFEGTIGSHNGTAVFELRGTFDGDGASIDMTLVPGTATGDLSLLTLTGKAFAPPSGDGSLMLFDESAGTRGWLDNQLRWKPARVRTRE